MPKKKADPQKIDRRPAIGKIRMIYEMLLSGLVVDQKTAAVILGSAIEALELAETGSTRILKKYMLPKEDYSDILFHYFSTFERCRGIPPVMTGRTGKAIKDMLKIMSISDIRDSIDMAFEDPWFRDKNGEMYYIAANINKYRRPKEVSPPLAQIPELPKDAGGMPFDIELADKLGLL